MMATQRAVAGHEQSLSAAVLATRVERVASALRAARPTVRTLGLLADNGPDWVVADLAAERAGVPLVPLPQFFTRAQLQHAADACG
ncbi:MAG: AMP-binding protein, partial [Burkholderiaceae bacterium]